MLKDICGLWHHENEMDQSIEQYNRWYKVYISTSPTPPITTSSYTSRLHISHPMMTYHQIKVLSKTTHHTFILLPNIIFWEFRSCKTATLESSVYFFFTRTRKFCCNAFFYIILSQKRKYIYL